MKYLFVIISLIITSVWAQGQIPGQGGQAPKNYISQASSGIVSHLLEYRKSTVNEAQASSEANHFVTQVLNHPPFASLASQATGIVSGSSFDKQKALSLLQGVNKEYNAWSAGSSFAPYTSYFKAHVTDFAVDQAYEDAQSTYKVVAPLVKPYVSRFFTDPTGKNIGTTATNLGKHIASDFGYAAYATAIPTIPA